MESYHVKIITENGANFTNIDEARNYWFNAGTRDGISKGILNEGVFTTTESNVLYFDTCELRIGGHRFLLDQAYQYSFSSYPTVATRYALVATVIVDDNENVTFTLGIQDASTPLVKDKLYKHLNGAGTYQVEIGRFTLTTNGTVEDVTRTIDIITGGKGSGDGAINIGNVTTHTLEAGLEAEVDVEQRLNQEDGKTYTDFNFDIPMGDKGDTGATGVGISTITAGTPTVSGGTTTTPIIITLTDNTPIVVNIVAQNGTNGTNGTNGASVSDVQFTYASTDADGNKVYNVMTTVGNGTPFNSGSITSPKGAKGDTGNTGATGIGVSAITAGTPTQSGNTTVTPITVTLTNGNTQSFNVVAQNGANGSNGTNGSNGASVTDVQVIYSSTDANGNNIYNVTSTIGGSTVNSGTITAPKGDAGATPTDYAKDDASNLTSANKDSWNTALSNTKAYFSSNVIDFTGTTPTSLITISSKESQYVTLSNSTLTIQKAGLYRILISAVVTADNRPCKLRIVKNDTTVIDETDVWGTFGNFQESVNSLCKLSVGDKINFTFITDSGASYSIWRVKAMLWEV